MDNQNKKSGVIKKGEIRNPKGRPVSEASRLRSEMRDAFSAELYPNFKNITDTAYSMVVHDRDTSALRLVLEYCLGRPPQAKEDDDEQVFDAREMIRVSTLFSLFSPYLTSTQLEEIRQKLNTLAGQEKESEEKRQTSHKEKELEIQTVLDSIKCPTWRKWCSLLYQRRKIKPPLLESISKVRFIEFDGLECSVTASEEERGLLGNSILRGALLDIIREVLAK